MVLQNDGAHAGGFSLADEFKVVDESAEDIGAGVAVEVDDAVEEIVGLGGGLLGEGAGSEKREQEED